MNTRGIVMVGIQGIGSLSITPSSGGWARLDFGQSSALRWRCVVLEIACDLYSTRIRVSVSIVRRMELTEATGLQCLSFLLGSILGISRDPFRAQIDIIRTNTDNTTTCLSNKCTVFNPCLTVPPENVIRVKNRDINEPVKDSSRLKYSIYKE